MELLFTLAIQFTSFTFVYVGDRFKSRIFEPIANRACSLELLWVMLMKDEQTCYVAVLYHPPIQYNQKYYIVQLIA